VILDRELVADSDGLDQLHRQNVLAAECESAAGLEAGGVYHLDLDAAAVLGEYAIERVGSERSMLEQLASR